MFEIIPFRTIRGKTLEPNLKLFSLSTCAFCKRARDFLNKHDFSYSYLMVNALDDETRAEISREFEDKFNSKLRFPTLVIDDTDFLPGFIEIDWRNTLGI